MELTKIYQLLQGAIDFNQFMFLNNKIVENQEQEELTNNREGSRIDEAIKGKTKILNLINKATKSSN